MSPDAVPSKADLRRQLATRARGVSDEERQADSAFACALLRSQPSWQGAKSLLFYAPLRDELDLWPMLGEAIAEARLTALPRFCPARDSYEAALVRDPGADLEPRRFGVLEPRPECPVVPLNQLDLVLVPGVGFDLSGRRLGRGRGYYDRLLSAVRGIRCGVAAEWQVLPAVPREPHDELVDCILTPTRWIVCRPRAVRK